MPDNPLPWLHSFIDHWLHPALGTIKTAVLALVPGVNLAACASGHSVGRGSLMGGVVWLVLPRQDHFSPEMSGKFSRREELQEGGT